MSMLEYDEMSSQPPAWYPAIEQLLKHEKHEEAARAAEDVLAKCRKAGKDADTAQVLRAMAMIDLYDRDDERGGEKPLSCGLSVADEALALSRKAKDESGEAAALHLKAKIHMRNREIEEGMREAGEALTKSQALRDKCAEAYVLNTVARFHHISNEVTEAMRLTNDSLAIFEELDDIRGLISTLQTLYRLHMHSHDRWQTIIVMDELVDLHRRLGDAIGEGTACVLAAQYEMEVGNPQGALPRAQHGAELFQREGLAKKHGSALLCAAAASVALGDLESGRATAKEAADVLRRINDLGGQAAASCVLANAHRTQEEFRKAANRFEEAAMLYGQEGDKLAKANSMREVSTCLVKMLTNDPEVPEDGWPKENMQEPLRAAKTSASLFQQLRDTQSEAYGFTLQQLSNCHLVNRELPEAISRGKESLRIFERTGNHQGATSAHGALSQAVALKGDNTEALRLAKEGLKLAKRANDQTHILFHQRLINSYGPAAAKEQEAAESATEIKPTTAAKKHNSDNCAYLNGVPVVTYDTFEPRVATAPTPQKAKEEDELGRPAKKDKVNVVYQARWVKSPGAKAEIKPEEGPSRRVRKDVRSMGPHGGREVLPVGELPSGFETSDFEPDDAESWRRPSPTDGYQQRILASAGDRL